MQQVAQSVYRLKGVFISQVDLMDSLENVFTNEKILFQFAKRFQLVQYHWQVEFSLIVIDKLEISQDAMNELFF